MGLKITNLSHVNIISLFFNKYNERNKIFLLLLKEMFSRLFVENTGKNA